jgi:hypothetical protein
VNNKGDYQDYFDGDVQLEGYPVAYGGEKIYAQWDNEYLTLHCLESNWVTVDGSIKGVNGQIRYTVLIRADEPEYLVFDVSVSSEGSTVEKYYAVQAASKEEALSRLNAVLKDRYGRDYPPIISFGPEVQHIAVLLAEHDTDLVIQLTLLKKIAMTFSLRECRGDFS